MEVNLPPDLEGKVARAADHAERLLRALYDAPASLLPFPNRGRKTRARW